MDCPCTKYLRLDPLRRTRSLAFVADLAAARALWEQRPGLDAVFCQTNPEQRKQGRTWLVCACETGWTRVGASVGVIYGLPGPALVEAYKAIPDPLVVCAVHTGGDLADPAVAQIRALAQADPRKVLLVVPFGSVVHTQQLDVPRLRAEVLAAPTPSVPEEPRAEEVPDPEPPPPPADEPPDADG